MRLVPTTPRPATPRRSGFSIDSSLRRPRLRLVRPCAAVAVADQRSAGGRSAVPLGGGPLLFLALLAGGVAGVALELALVFEPLFFFPEALRFSLASHRLETKLLLPRCFLGGAAGGFVHGLLSLSLGALGVAQRARLENRLALRFALDHRGVCWIMLGVGEEFFGHRLPRFGGRRLAVSKAVTVHKRHRFLSD